MKTQTILTPSGDRLVVLPEADFEALVEAAEDASDSRAVAAFRSRLAVGEEELIPSLVVNRLLRGDNPVRVWREYRELTSQALAEKAGIGQGFLSQIETWKRAGTVDTLRKIAAALDVSIDELLEDHDVVSEQQNERIKRLLREATNGITFAELMEKSRADHGHGRTVCKYHVDRGDVEKRGDLYFWVGGAIERV